MKVFVILLCSAAGLWMTLRYFLKNIREIRVKPVHRSEDKYFNYPLMFLWFGYLLVFFTGLVVNNLIIR